MCSTVYVSACGCRSYIPWNIECAWTLIAPSAENWSSTALQAGKLYVISIDVRSAVKHVRAPDDPCHHSPVSANTVNLSSSRDSPSFSLETEEDVQVDQPFGLPR